MSGFNTPRSTAAQPKQISSRLLNMKFMQRAAAADKNKPGSSPQTPGSQPQFKRRRTDDFESGQNSPSTPGTPYTTNTKNPFGDPSSTTRSHASFAGGPVETQWVLKVNSPVGPSSSTTQASYHNTGENEDEEDDGEDDVWNTTAPSGRQIYGTLKKKTASTNMTTNTPSSTAVGTRSPTSATSTPTSLSKSAKRNAKNKDRLSKDSYAPSRGGVDLLIEDDDEDEDDDSDTASSSDSDTDSEPDAASRSTSARPRDNNLESSKPNKPPIDFMSEEYNKKLDSMDFRSSGFGKQRLGLTGGGGDGKKAKHKNQGNTSKNRKKLGGQGFFENKNKQRKSM